MKKIIFILLYIFIINNLYSAGIYDNGKNTGTNSYLPPIRMEENQYKSIHLVGIIQYRPNNKNFFLLLDGSIFVQIAHEIPLTEYDIPEFVDQRYKIQIEIIELKRLR